jgi:hypothetical protein
MKNFTSKHLGVLGLAGISVAILLCGTAIAATNTPETSASIPATISERLNERKSTIKLQLTADQTQKITKNCTSAQKLIKSISAQDQNNATKRKQVYTNVSSHLAQVIESLNKKGTDTTGLKNIQTQFNDAANQYLIDAATYKTTMEDLSAIDCASDPTGFDVTLTAARQLRTKLSSEVGQVASVKTLLTEELVKSASNVNKTQAQEPKQ